MFIYRKMMATVKLHSKEVLSKELEWERAYFFLKRRFIIIIIIIIKVFMLGWIYKILELSWYLHPLSSFSWIFFFLRSFSKSKLNFIPTDTYRVNITINLK
jgi:hypothetical protein